MTIKRLKELRHHEIAHLAWMNAGANECMFKTPENTPLPDLFSFRDSPEGFVFWAEVCSENFTKVYSKIAELQKEDWFIARWYHPPKLKSDCSQTINTDYRPLMDIFTIGTSDIEGLGLFLNIASLSSLERLIVCTGSGDKAVLTIPTHFEVDGEVVRTPIGGMINHSETPNCKLVKVVDSYEKFDCIYYLVPLDVITKGEEITVDYRKQKICGK